MCCNRPGIVALLVLSACMGVEPALAESTDTAPTLPKPTAKIMLLGTFHFSDAGLDDYKPKHDVDILSAARQKELTQVLDGLAGFRPTKIAVEWMPEHQARVNETYRAYVAGDFELPSNEVYQLGFRLAKRLGHRQVYLVDAKKRNYEPWVSPDKYAKKHGQRGIVRSDWYDQFKKISRHEDKLKMETTLRDTLLRMNTEERVLASHGIYLIGSFKAGVGDEYPGVDSKTAWYNRNLRIFANLQRITEQEDERILLIIGAGHLPILRHTVQASPEYELVEVGDHL